MARLVVFPELALTTFFPRWWMEDEAELDAFYEDEMPNATARPLFDLGRELGVGFYLGYAEIVREGNRKRRFNTSILVDPAGRIAGKYRKVHLPGHANHEPDWPFQHLEKAYFEPGDLGFPVFDAFDGRIGMCICNDRRWPETYRVMGLKGVEIVLLGYNTPVSTIRARRSSTTSRTSTITSPCRPGADQNGAWVVGVAKAGREEGCDLIGQSCIIAPTGEIVAMCTTLEDEVVVADCDLDRCSEISRKTSSTSPSIGSRGTTGSSPSSRNGYEPGLRNSRS